MAVPVVDLAAVTGPAARDLPLAELDSEAVREVAEALGRACRHVGFFYVRNHGVSEALLSELQAMSRDFFAQPLADKMRLDMRQGGRAWRGYFPVGDELTSGKPDIKEGLYFGAELSETHPAVVAGRPIHGRNQFADERMRRVVLEYLEAMLALGQRIMALLALSLGLEADFFQRSYTREPTPLFRIFNYPRPESFNYDGDREALWGVGEHTDYGLLTILLQDECGGLQVKTRTGWQAAPPLPGTFVCNIGDMLERITGGYFCSTPHRVRNAAGRDRLSFPFFFDPSWEAEIRPLPNVRLLAEEAARTQESDEPDARAQRWDQANVVQDEIGAYGDYLTRKVSKCFPDLFASVQSRPVATTP
ncbi:uncharacterized protein MONBRDRAFT_10301 [Monosiga brevicollis MX1]|uniref:Fe2OG dioxygenase domain-containing protein n=1 Tax=Monosiga brevicollis TaxID=81824 RepID=A9V5T7_MONBE|nr:uncharacterized protein MONBRDRAFT_10301 [Monosiga brevicollis MX1]EDQ87100.1 predicted protein [Monosiga brevicollis MX1]|eukprot:XP_001748043.1 hypothetical protein [Monosiga brevicollis MX1]